MNEHSKEGERLIKLLKNKDDWEVKRYYDKLTQYWCLKNKRSDFLLVPVNGFFTHQIYTAYLKPKTALDIGIWDKSFLTKKDNKTIYKIVNQMINEYLNPTKSNDFISRIIMNTPVQLS